MPVTLSKFVEDFGEAIQVADSRSPQEAPYLPGIGPHKERNTVKLVVDEIRSRPGCVYSNDMALEIKYPSSPRSKCDICIGREPDWDWAIEVKMLRFLGNNGKPDDNILMHILSPYSSHRSALTDCQKLVDSGFSGRKAIVIYGYDYDEWPMDPAIDAFELLATKQNSLSERCEASFEGLIHPFHQHGRVFAWEILSQPV